MSEICSEDKYVEPYMEGELSDEQKREFEQHLQSCSYCQLQVESCQKGKSTMQKVTEKAGALERRIEEKLHTIEQGITCGMEKLRQCLEKKSDGTEENLTEKMRRYSEGLEEFGQQLEKLGEGIEELGEEVEEFGEETEGLGEELEEFVEEMEEVAEEIHQGKAAIQQILTRRGVGTNV